MYPTFLEHVDIKNSTVRSRYSIHYDCFYVVNWLYTLVKIVASHIQENLKMRHCEAIRN